jgi:hypothetical protein
VPATTRRLAAFSLAAMLALPLAACSKDSSDGAKADPTTTTAAGSSDGTDDTTATTTGDDTASSGACVTDTNEPSGSSTVIWKDAEVTEDHKLSLSDTSLTPNTLTVAVNESFAVVNDGDGIAAVAVGCAGAQTVPKGMAAYFVVTSPGTFTITNQAANGYAGAEVGTVTVQ